VQYPNGNNGVGCGWLWLIGLSGDIYVHRLAECGSSAKNPNPLLRQPKPFSALPLAVASGM